MPVPISSKHEEAFEKCVAALGPDMPLLMHGSGDVRPERVDQDSAALVARLTTEYISKLCSAAVVDAHDILTDGAGGMLPPPAIQKTLHPMPYSEELKHPEKRKSPGEEYWDDPLPNPKVKGTSKPSSEPQPQQQPWVGLHGVDFYQASRTRKRHIQHAIDAQSFVFPICHDAELYQRVVQLQAAQRETQRILEDSVITELIQEEYSKPKEDDEEEEELLDPEWPGMHSILPMHRFDSIEEMAIMGTGTSKS
jgi:hypothetical protein